MDLQLQEKTFLVTGGASGLGAQLTRTLVEEGARVALNYRSRKTDAEALVSELGADNVVPIQADLRDFAQVNHLYDAAIEAFGHLDGLVNNAGLWLTTTIGSISEEDWDASIDVNLKAPMQLSQRFAQSCIDDGRPGRILNITSQAAFRGSSTRHLPYATAKGGLVTMTRSIAREMADNGVTANALAIGIMETTMIAEALKTRREYYENQLPIGRIATTREIADIAVFLLSPRSGYMTGATVDVSGGQVMH